jgi:transcriptional regulator with XRE-family HTH domain
MKNDWLIQLRITRNFTQQYVAESIGMSKQQISRIERNQQYGSTKTLEKLAQLYGITIDELLKKRTYQCYQQRQV